MDKRQARTLAARTLAALGIALGMAAGLLDTQGIVLVDPPVAGIAAVVVRMVVAQCMVVVHCNRVECTLVVVHRDQVLDSRVGLEVEDMP